MALAIATKPSVTPRTGGHVHVVEYSKTMLEDDDFIQQVRQHILDNDGYVFKGMVAKELIDEIVAYLSCVGRNSFPSYHPLVDGCPNFHRVVQGDKRAYVASMCHQFVFHPWNQDVFNVFEKMKHIYHLRNLICGCKRDAFLDATPKSAHIARLAFVHYPRGGGMIKRHSDPIGEHQLGVPVLQLTQKSEDYQVGGGYVVGHDGEMVDTDAMLQKGDLLFFNAEVMHGVAPIDPGEKLDWLSFRGRWSMMSAIIKTVADTDTPNSIQLEA